MKIGNIDIPSNVILAPMADVTDPVYRMICRMHGCECAVTEMVNARALSYSNKNTLKMLEAHPEDRPLGLQLVGHESGYFISALKKLSEAGVHYDFIDINAGCPVKKVVNNMEGSALMKDTDLLKKIVSTVRRNTDKPVTVKIRAGFSDSSRNAVEAAMKCRDAGVSAVFIHGRTREQFYSGRVDKNIIRQVRNALDVPVVASGDIFSPQDAQDMMNDTGVDGVMVARGSYGDPWIFERIKIYFRTGIIVPFPGTDAVADMMIYHLRKMCEFYSPEHGPCVFRKVFVWYTKGFSGTKDLRRRIFSAATEQECMDVINDFRLCRRNV